MVALTLALQYKPPLLKKKSDLNGEGGHIPPGASLVKKTTNFSATYTVSSPPDAGKGLRLYMYWYTSFSIQL